MLKRLRWKFIGMAMLAVFIVLAVLVGGILLSFRRVTSRYRRQHLLLSFLHACFLENVTGATFRVDLHALYR